MLRPFILAMALAALPGLATAQQGDSPVTGHHAAPDAASPSATTTTTSTATTTGAATATTTHPTHPPAHHPVHGAAQHAPAASTANAAPTTHTIHLRPIEPNNSLEYAFVAAASNDQMRPAFRQRLLDSMVVVAMTSADENARPLLVPLEGGQHAAAIFTSVDRLTSVLGPSAFYVTINGRDALSRLHGEHVVINYLLMPMLTLDPDDVAHFLSIPIQPQQ
ncbi:MAG: SseB family protein [Alphaproteobacteria bacterium]